MTYSMNDKVLVLVDQNGSANVLEGTIVGGTPFSVTIELEDGKVVDSRSKGIRILPNPA